MILQYVFVLLQKKTGSLKGIIMELLNICSSYTTVYIYGDGEMGRLIRIYLHEQGINVKAFVTTDKPRHSHLLDIPVCELDMISELRDPSVCVLVCVNAKAANEVMNLIHNRGGKGYVVDDDTKVFVYGVTNFLHDYKDIEQEPKVSVLLYHRVGNFNDPYNIVVSNENFKHQLIYIKDHYEIIRCDEPLRAKGKKTVALTFDDGYVDFYTNAYPLLCEYQIPATVFISTGNIGKDHEFWWDELEYIIFGDRLPEYFDICGKKIDTKAYDSRKKLLLKIRKLLLDKSFRDRDLIMNEIWNQAGQVRICRDGNRTMKKQEIEEIAKNPLITIGAHTVSHSICSNENGIDLIDQIRESKETLEDIINREVNMFSYPNGEFDEKSVETVRELGFMRAFTCVHACVCDENKEYEIPRFGIMNWSRESINKGFRGLWLTDRGHY